MFNFISYKLKRHVQLYVLNEQMLCGVARPCRREEHVQRDLRKGRAVAIPFFKTYYYYYCYYVCYHYYHYYHCYSYY